jgi:ADP-ribose pyrophosphatase YjhB (NUDIX family)
MRRAVCPYCDHIQYQNPLLVVGTIPHQGDQILLCQRNIEPGKGLWTLPSGYMEIGETLAEAAIRETREEAGATVALQSLFTILSSATFGFVHCYYLAKLLESDFNFGHESLAVQLFSEEDIPWNAIAFSSVRTTLRHYFEDRLNNNYSLHEHSLF